MAKITANWMSGIQYSPQDDRLLIDGIMATPGTVDQDSFKVTQKASPSMKLDVRKGSAFVEGTRIANQGMYHINSDGTEEVEISASDATRNRIDLVSAVIEDPQYIGFGEPKIKLIVTKGVPGQTPTRPISPPDSLDLATVLVKKGVKSISNADIQNIAPRATAVGGIAYVRNYLELTEGLPRIDGLHAYRKDINRIMVCDGRSWSYMNTKPSNDTGWMNINVPKKYQAEPTQYRVYGDMVFCRGAIKGYQLNKKNVKKFNRIASINPKYAPPYTVQNMSGINTTVSNGVEYKKNGEIHLYYGGVTRTWAFMNASWLL